LALELFRYEESLHFAVGLKPFPGLLEFRARFLRTDGNDSAGNVVPRDAVVEHGHQHAACRCFVAAWEGGELLLDTLERQILTEPLVVLSREIPAGERDVE